MNLSELVACTLTDTDLKTQRERWISLGQNFGLGRTETDDGLRLTFTHPPAVVAELEARVQVVNEGCSWAAWRVEHVGEGTFEMVASSPVEVLVTLRGLF